MFLSADVRQAFRSLLRSPLLTTVAVLSIGLSIGAITSVYSWLNAVVLHPFPEIRDPERVVGLEVAGPDGDGWPVSYPVVREWRSASQLFTDVAGWTIVRASVRDAGERTSRSLIALLASGNYFDLLGAYPVLGRSIERRDERVLNAVTVLGYAYWERQYARDPSVIGRSIYVNGSPVQIVGVLRQGFAGTYVGVVPDFYLPVSLYPRLMGKDVLNNRGARQFQAIGRLAPGVTNERTQRELDVFARHLSVGAGDRPVTGVVVKDIRTQYLGGVVYPLFAAMLAVGVLLLFVACANVASLMLMRASARSHEVAVRVALGASSARLALVTLGEVGVIAVVAAAIGIFSAALARGLLYQLIPTGALPLTLPVKLDLRVLGIAFGCCAMVGALCAIAPIIHLAKIPPASALRASVRTIAGGSSRFRNVIVSTQIGFSLCGLTVALLFVNALRAASHVRLGFSDPEHVLLVTTNLIPIHVSDGAGVNVIESIRTRAAALPGVKNATVATFVPLGLGGRPVADFRVEGFAPAPNQNMSSIRVSVGPDYAALMGTRLIIGRDIVKADQGATLPVVVVNETFARRFYTDAASALGHRIDAGHGWATIVGVVADGKYGSLTEKPQAVAYFPITQWYEPSFTLYVRTEANASAMTESIRRALQSVHFDIPVLQPRTLAQHIAAATFVQRTGASILGSFGAVALALSLIGLYGALGIVVALRRQEIGVRLSLGATTRSIALLVLRHGLMIATAGVTIGLPLAFVIAQLLHAQFATQSTVSHSAFVSAAALVMTAAMCATLKPMRRAASVSPIEALRAE